MTVEVEVTPEVFSDKIRALEDVRARLAKAIEHILGIRVELRLVEPRSIPRSIHRSSPRSTPRSIYRSIPRSDTRSTPRSTPRSIPRSNPRSTPRSTPRSIPRFCLEQLPLRQRLTIRFKPILSSTQLSQELHNQHSIRSVLHLTHRCTPSCLPQQKQ
jgi:hypothetical protein